MCLMMDYGYKAVSIDDVAKASKVSKGAIYHYFDSKADLGVETLNYYFDKLRSLLSFGESTSGVDQLVAYLDSFIDIYREKAVGRNVCLIGLFANELHDKKLTHTAKLYFDAWVEALQPVTQRAIEESDCGLAPYDLARQLVAIIEGCLVLHAADDDDDKLIQSVEAYKHMLLITLGEKK